MTAVSGFLKPCYVFAPRVLARRVRLWLFGDQAERRLVTLPWGAKLEVNPHETVGGEIVRQNVFDIAVSEAAWRLLQPGDRAVDVGANIGYMTSLFAARVGPTGRVDSFEPHPRIAARLAHNVGRFARGSVARVELHRVALGDEIGTAQLRRRSRRLAHRDARPTVSRWR